MEENNRKLEKKMFNLQIRYMVGFVLCILLASFSLWAAIFSTYSYKIVFAAIAILAFAQAIIRLFQLNISQPE